MSFRLTAVLFVVLGLLVAAYYGMQWRGEREVVLREEAKALFAFEAEDVLALTIAPLGEVRVRGERTGDGSWSIVEPNPTIEPFVSLWDRVAAAVASLKVQRTLDVAAGEADAEAYGLDPPLLEVEADIRDGDSLSFVFGKLEPTEANHYARINDGPLQLISKNEVFELNRKLELLRHRFIVDDPNAPIVRFEFTRFFQGPVAEDGSGPQFGEASVPVVLERADAESPWRMLSPVVAPADQEAAESLVRELQSTRGYAYVENPESIADYGLAPAFSRVALFAEGSDAPATTLLGDLDTVGEPAGIFAQLEGRDAVFKLDPHIESLIPKRPDGLRDRRLLTRSLEGLERVVYERGESRLELAVDDSGTWALIDPPIPDTSQQAISRFLSNLKAASLEVFEADSPSEAGLDRPDVRISLYYAGEAGPLRIALTEDASSDIGQYALQDTGAVGRMLEAFGRGLLVTWHDFRSRELLRFSQSDVQRLSFRFEGQAFDIQRVHAQWIIEQPEGWRLSTQADVGRMLDAINPLFATEVVAESSSDAPDAYGFEAPVLEVTVTVQGEGDAEATTFGPLTIGEASAAEVLRRYARVADRDGVYEIRQDVIDVYRDALRGFLTASGNPFLSRGSG